MKLLVIDDSPLVRNCLKLDLSEAGHEVVLASDGREGLEKFAAVAPDVVLSDLNMPELDGLGVLRLLQERAPLVPVIIFTDDDEVERAVGALREGAAGYLVKGASAATIAQELNRALERRRVMERNRELEEANQRYRADLEATLAAKTAEIARLERLRAQGEKVVALGTIAAGVAHEINSPIAVVTSNVEWLAESLAPGLARLVELAEDKSFGCAEGARELARLLEPGFLVELKDLQVMLRDTREGCDRITHLVASLKRLARSSTSRQNTCELGMAVSEVATRLGPALSGRARFNVKIEPPNQRVALSMADASSVLTNLLENAALAVEPGRGEITVTATQTSAGECTLCIEDNGCGISPENLPRVSEPFFTTRPPGQGTGLGLCLVTHLVRGIGGDIHVASEVGRGTMVTVTLPVPSAEASRPSSSGRYDVAETPGAADRPAA